MDLLNLTYEPRLASSGLGNPLNLSFGMATSVLHNASTTHWSSHRATQHEKYQPYLHPCSKRPSHKSPLPHCGVWHGMPVGNVLHTLSIRGAVYCRKVQQHVEVYPQGYVLLQGSVARCEMLVDIHSHELLRVLGADQNLTPETYTPHLDSIMCQLHGYVCLEWTSVVQGSVARCAFGRCCTPLSLSCAPGSGSGVPRPGGEGPEGLVCPLRGGSGVPSPQRVWCALNEEGLVCPPRGESGVPSLWGRVWGVWCALTVGEGLVCLPQGRSGVPPPPLTFVSVIVIIIIVILTIQGSGPCIYQTSPSCPFDELRRIARHVWWQHLMTIKSDFKPALNIVNRKREATPLGGVRTCACVL